MSLTGNIGRICLVLGQRLLLNQRVAKLVPKEKKFRSFVYLLFRQRDFQEKLERVATGVAQQNLSPIQTSEMELLCPSAKILAHFSQVTEPMIDMILNLFSRTENLRTTRDLLPKLISGELDVSELDIQVPQAETAA